MDVPKPNVVGGEGGGAVREQKNDLAESTRSETPDEKERRWNLNGNDGRETGSERGLYFVRSRSQSMAIELRIQSVTLSLRQYTRRDVLVAKSEPACR